MNWKPKKGVGKTLYAVDTWNYNFNSTSPYGAWTSDIGCPTIIKYTDVMIITNGSTKGSTYIVAKKKCDSITNSKTRDTEYKTYKLKKINSINEDKQGVVLMRGQNIVISNNKKELLNIVSGLYKMKEIAARKAINEYNTGAFRHHYAYSEWIGQKLMSQPKHIITSYKNFVENLKKI